MRSMQTASSQAHSTSPTVYRPCSLPPIIASDAVVDRLLEIIDGLWEDMIFIGLDIGSTAVGGCRR